MSETYDLILIGLIILVGLVIFWFIKTTVELQEFRNCYNIQFNDKLCKKYLDY